MTAAWTLLEQVRLEVDPLLGLSAVAYVEQHSCRNRGFPTSSRTTTDSSRTHDPPLVGRQPVLELERGPRLVGACVFGEDTFAILPGIHEELGVGQPLLGAVPRHALGLRAHVDRGVHVVERVDVGNGGDLLDEGPYLGSLSP